jgi:hypothetical protein
LLPGFLVTSDPSLTHTRFGPVTSPRGSPSGPRSPTPLVSMADTACAGRRLSLGVRAVHTSPCSSRPRPYLRRRLALRALAQAPLAFVLPRPVSAASVRTKPRRQPPREPTQGSAGGRRRSHLELRHAESHTRHFLWSPVDH